MSARFPEPCDGITGVHDGPVRFYRTGWKCNTHSPWAEAGQPEPQPGPGISPDAAPCPMSASALFDDRAVASGRRRSSPATYRAAQAAVHKTT